MYDDIKLARPDLALDPVHDGRHLLPDVPFARESIPYCLHLPDKGIAAFTYTWVNRAGEAGSAMAIFGPGVGDKPIEQRLPDKKVPDNMDFSEWQIEGFSMRSGLDFKHASVSWKTDAGSVEFDFEALHPPYAYGAHAEGCPSFTAIDRIEQSGRVKGQFVINGEKIPFEGFGHRDHSWGSRMWAAFQYYNWYQGQSDDGRIIVHYWRYFALGRFHLRGYVVKDGLMAEITDVQTDIGYDDAFRQQKLVSLVTDEAGRKTKLSADFYAHYTLKPSDEFHLLEGAATATYDDLPGVGWMELGCPPYYFDFVQKNGPFKELEQVK